MKRASSKVVVALVCAGVLTGMLPSSLAEAATVVATPTALRVTPGVGGVTVSWNPVAGTLVNYAVSSAPPGASCTAVNKSSCFVTDTSSTRYTFSVMASAPGLGPSLPSPATPALAPRLVLVLAGQSNANGYESYAVDPVTKINYMAAPYANGADTHDQITWLPWSEIQGAGGTPVPLDSPQQIGTPPNTTTIFGPELGLARQIWTDTGKAVTIVKAAYTGTAIATNWNPNKKGSIPNGLFGGMVTKVQAVMAADATAGQFDVLGGFYWYQGESETTHAGWARAYQAHLQKLVAAVRAQLPMSPTAPVVLAKEDLSGYIAYMDSIGILSSGKKAAYLAGNATVRAADDWAAANLPDVVETDTYPLERAAPLYVHLDNVGQLILGSRLAKVSESRLP